MTGDVENVLLLNAHILALWQESSMYIHSSSSVVVFISLLICSLSSSNVWGFLAYTLYFKFADNWKSQTVESGDKVNIYLPTVPLPLSRGSVCQRPSMCSGNCSGSIFFFQIASKNWLISVANVCLPCCINSEEFGRDLEIFTLWIFLLQLTSKSVGSGVSHSAVCVSMSPSLPLCTFSNLLKIVFAYVEDGVWIFEQSSFSFLIKLIQWVSLE